MDLFESAIPVAIGAVLGWVAGILMERNRRQHEFTVRFDSVRREHYASFLGTVAQVVTTAAQLIGEDAEQADSTRRTLLQIRDSIFVHYAALLLVASDSVRLAAGPVKDLAMEITDGAIRIRAGLNAAPPRLPPEFSIWGERLDAALRDLIQAAQRELRIPITPQSGRWPRWWKSIGRA